MIIKRKQKRRVPGLNTAALPDLIFTVLFFFMLVTHMRTETQQVAYQSPKGKQLSTVAPKAAIVSIYVGMPIDRKSDNFQIQIGDRIVDINHLRQHIEQQQASLSPENAEEMIVALKIDKNCPMAIVNRIKQELRAAGALKISYIATNQNDSVR